MEHRAAAGQTGIGAGQHVDADALLEGVVGPDALRRRRRRAACPSKARACTTTLPRRVADAQPVAVGERRAPASISGWTSAVGRPSRAMLDGVLLKLVLRNERDGAAHQAERLLGIAVVDHRDMVGKRRQSRVARARSPPNRRGNEISCRHGRSRRGNARVSKGGQQSSQPPCRRSSSASGRPLSAQASGRSSRIALIAKPGCARAEPLARARRSRRGWSGTRHRARPPRGRSAG